MIVRYIGGVLAITIALSVAVEIYSLAILIENLLCSEFNFFLIDLNLNLCIKRNEQYLRRDPTTALNMTLLAQLEWGTTQPNDFGGCLS